MASQIVTSVFSGYMFEAIEHITSKFYPFPWFAIFTVLRAVSKLEFDEVAAFCGESFTCPGYG